MPGGPTTPTTAPGHDCTVQQALDGGHLPPPTDQSRLARPTARCRSPMPSSRRAGTGTSAPLMWTIWFAEHRGVINQLRGGRAEHHPTRRCHRLHPLRHPDLFADGGVTQAPEPISPAITLPEFRPTRSRRSTPSRSWTSTASRSPPLECPGPPDRHEKRGPPTQPARRTPP